MMLSNLGLISISDRKYIDLLVNAINKSGLLSKDDPITTADLVCDTDGLNCFIVEDVSGDIEPYLDNVADVFIENGCVDALSMQIHYFGDYDGYYCMEDGHVQSLTSEEYYVHNMPESDLIKEITRRKSKSTNNIGYMKFYAETTYADDEKLYSTYDCDFSAIPKDVFDIFDYIRELFKTTAAAAYPSEVVDCRLITVEEYEANAYQIRNIHPIDKLSKDEQKIIKSIPNFDADIFHTCTGIKV